MNTAIVRPLIPVLLAIVASFLSACANYHLGTGGTPSFRTVFVVPVENRTLLPQAQALLTTDLRESFGRDGRIALVNSAESADVTLKVTINDYHRDVAAARADDTGLARKFNVTLAAVCTLNDRRTGKPIFENRPVHALREVFTDSGQLQAEYQTLPLLSQSLAGKVVHAILDVW